jgi:hypothetical protein
MDALSPNGLTLFDGVELKLFDRKLTPETIFGFLSRMDDWPRKDVKYESLSEYIFAFVLKGLIGSMRNCVSIYQV